MLNLFSLRTCTSTPGHAGSQHIYHPPVFVLQFWTIRTCRACWFWVCDNSSGSLREIWPDMLVVSYVNLTWHINRRMRGAVVICERVVVDVEFPAPPFPD